jgi:hypothetical protein
VTEGGKVERARSEGGQAIVEFVVVLPLVFGLIFLVVWAGIALNSWLRVTDAARVAAREGATARFDGDDPCTAATVAAEQAVGGLQIDVECSAGDPGEPLELTVTNTMNPPFESIWDWLNVDVPDVEISGSAAERIE